MNNRIAQILKYLSLSSSSFAAEIGVQRSSISHVLSGRNKPSLEFIQKIVTAYPEINIDWLITGNGTIDNSTSNDYSKGSISPVSKDKHIFPAESNKMAKEFSVESLNKENLVTKRTLKSIKKIEKLILVYNDKTFEEIYPAD